MTPEQREHHDQQITEFRYQLVAELANPYLSAAERRELIRQKATVPHEVPFLGRRRYSVGCIHQWLALYRKHGRAGLAPRARRDAGRSRSLSDTEAAGLLNYLETHPELTASAALRTLQTDGRITGTPSSSALSRLVRSAGLQRSARQRQAHGEQHLKFEFLRPAGVCSGRLHVRTTPARRQRPPPHRPAARLPRRRHPPGGLRRLGIQRDRSRLRGRHPSHPGRSWPHRSPVLRPRSILCQQPDPPHPRCSGPDHLPFAGAQTGWPRQGGKILPHRPPAVPGPAGDRPTGRHRRSRPALPHLAGKRVSPLAASRPEGRHPAGGLARQVPSHRAARSRRQPGGGVPSRSHPQGPPRLHRHSRRRPVRVAFHPDRRTRRPPLRPHLAAAQPPPVRPPRRPPRRRGAPGRLLRQRSCAPRRPAPRSLRRR